MQNFEFPDFWYVSFKDWINKRYHITENVEKIEMEEVWAKIDRNIFKKWKCEIFEKNEFSFRYDFIINLSWYSGYLNHLYVPGVFK